MTARSPDSERVAARAYSIWEEEGRPHGRDHAHWHRAESELTGQAVAPDAAGEAPPAEPKKLTRPRKSTALAGDEPAKPPRARKAAAPVQGEATSAAKRGKAKTPVA